MYSASLAWAKAARACSATNFKILIWIRIYSTVNMALDQVFGEGYDVKVDDSSADGGLLGENLKPIQVLNKSNAVVRY
jgi:hypothetical protein